MVYSSSDGSILQMAPWPVKKAFKFFENVLYGFVLFFNTLFRPDITRAGSGYTRNYRPGGGRQPPPTKKIGGLNLKPKMNMPGSCSSCSKY